MSRLLLPLLGGIISGNTLVQAFPRSMDGFSSYSINDIVGKSILASIEGTTVDPSAAARIATQELSELLISLTSITAAATTTDVTASDTTLSTVTSAIESPKPGQVSSTTTSSPSTLVSAAPVAASTVLGDQAKEAELCQQECVYAFSSCTTTLGTATTSRGANSMDCGALGNCYCFITPFIAGGTSVDRDLATHLCTSVSIRITC